MHPEPVEQCYVRVKAPAGIGAVQTFSNRHLTVGLDGIVEMSEDVPAQNSEFRLSPHSPDGTMFCGAMGLIMV